ncbi:MAG TPA: hypothetical protein VNV88_03745 [Candidatus Solibacter sp.]|nr:hypothetical protein [Candidatus Solibacter sp.]
MKKVSLFLFLACMLPLGCSSPSGKENSQGAQQQEPSQLETGRIALQKMIPPARFWAPDAQPVQVNSEVLKDSNGHDGKSGFWRATFASTGRQKAETFTWSGMSGSDTPRGVDHGAQDSFDPSNRSTRPFELSYLKIDSDKAFAVAQEHGGKKLLAKDPKAGVKYVLDWDPQASQLKWHVYYSGNDPSAKLAVVVNASSGEFLHKE